jgi:hypothetical protein
VAGVRLLGQRSYETTGHRSPTTAAANGGVTFLIGFEGSAGASSPGVGPLRGDALSALLSFQQNPFLSSAKLRAGGITPGEQSTPYVQ